MSNYYEMDKLPFQKNLYYVNALRGILNRTNEVVKEAALGKIEFLEFTDQFNKLVKELNIYIDGYKKSSMDMCNEWEKTTESVFRMIEESNNYCVETKNAIEKIKESLND